MKDETNEETGTQTTNVPTGPGVAGAGMSSQPDGKFMNRPYFDLPRDQFYNAAKGKKKKKHWKKFIGDDENGKRIQDWAKKNKGKPFLLRNKDTDEFVFARSPFR